MNDWISSLPIEKVEAWLDKNGEAAMAEHRVKDKYFAMWLAVLDRHCYRRTYMSYRDLEDWMYYDAYDSGMSPKEACMDMLEYNGYEVM